VIDVHGTAVELAGIGVLLRGASGSGKSDLALRLVDSGARLIADDRTLLRRQGDLLLASAPPTIAGRLEVRGIGIMSVPCVASAPLRLVVDLVAPGAVERLPEARFASLLGLDLPLILLAPFEPSAPAKLRLAARTHAG
jgi:serine kinase of HPr protein (carbohydrate metabolism regulator)